MHRQVAGNDYSLASMFLWASSISQVSSIRKLCWTHHQFGSNNVVVIAPVRTTVSLSCYVDVMSVGGFLFLLARKHSDVAAATVVRASTTSTQHWLGTNLKLVAKWHQHVCVCAFMCVCVCVALASSLRRKRQQKHHGLVADVDAFRHVMINLVENYNARKYIRTQVDIQKHERSGWTNEFEMRSTQRFDFASSLALQEPRVRI